MLNEMNVAANSRATPIPDIQGAVIGSLDAASGALFRAGYLPFGENTSTTTGRFRFTGRRSDANTASGAQPSGLYYYRARMYAPDLGRFLQPDPIGYAGGLNVYAYVGNDPLNLLDPLGLWTLQVGFSFYAGGWWLGGQVSFGVVADSHGNAGYYGTVGGGPTVGGGLKAGIGGAVSSAPTINDLNGPGAGVSVVAGAGVGGSFDWSKGTTQAGQTYNSWGGSVGPAVGAAISAGPSGTSVICQIGPDCGNSAQSGPASVPPAPASSNAPTSSIVPAGLTSAAQGGGVLGDTAGNQTPSLK